MKPPQKPKLEVRTFAHIREKYALTYYKEQFPCIACRATGKVYDPNDYDIIEGYKLASKIPCPECNGAREVKREVYSNILKEHKKIYHEKLVKYNILKSILGSLSDSEIQLMKSYFMWNKI